MKQPTLVGERILLRRLQDEDVSDEYIRWLNDPEVTRFMETGRDVSTRKTVLEYLDRFKQRTGDCIFAIIDRETGLHIGNVTLNNVSTVNKTADTGLMIGRKDFWGKGYAFEAWMLIIDYAFSELGLRKIIAGAIADNRASVETLKKLGFKVEGTFRQEYLVDGKYCDGIRFGLLKSEFNPTP